MKARIATVLSLTGVLVAGSAAALVNTQVLQGSAEQTTTTEVGALTASTPTLTSPPSSSTPLVAGGRQEVRVGDAGTVTLDSTAGALAVVSVAPAPGWTVASSGPGAMGGVEVHLVSPTVDVRFSALLVDGQLVTEVGATELGPVGSSPATIDDDDEVTSSSVHADDDGSEDEHEDHESEYEGSDDDD